jgi:hypothetical protein
MIYVVDNFFTPENFKFLQEYCKQDFTIQKAGEKEFSVLPTPKEILPLLNIDGHKLILSFIRSAYKGFDNDLRIHCDGLIMGEKTVLATVIYLNDPEGVTPNGTSFFKHFRYGLSLPDVTNEEFDRLITEDSNDESKWEQTDFISAVPNRLLAYSSNYFHAKYPKEITEGVRIVCVNFYSKEP